MKTVIKRMSDKRFTLLRNILKAPSPVGYERAMINVILNDVQGKIPKEWKVHSFKGNAGIVIDTNNEADADLTCMFIGHADKIRMQVRKIEKDGKIYIDSDSFLPQTLIGNKINIFSKHEQKYRKINGTVEALGAIHFAPPSYRSGSSGIKSEDLYVDLNLHEENAKKRITDEIGIKVGDPILLDRPVERTVAPDTFSGAYLDNGLGCFVTTELCKMVADDFDQLKNVRCLFSIATHEEIGRFGSMVLADYFKPDVVVGIDVNHNYVNAPKVAAKRFPEIKMGQGFTVSKGSIVSQQLNDYITNACEEADISIQLDVVGRDTGTDAMASSLTGTDSASTSVGIPVSNMHTVSESGCTRDIDACLYGLYHTVHSFSKNKVTPEDFKSGHIDLSEAEEFSELEYMEEKEDNDKEDNKE